MRVRQKLRDVVRGVLQTYGTSGVKKRLWDGEFSGGKWACLETTSGDSVYDCVERYAKGGSILDLGCGSGNTANELASTSYSSYFGVDISDAALDKARARSVAAGRGEKNRFAQGDVQKFVPSGRYDLILFRDSLYYVPRRSVKTLLHRYSQYLEDGGVFVVRVWHGTDKYDRYIETIEQTFDILERKNLTEPPAAIVVFRPSSASR